MRTDSVSDIQEILSAIICGRSYKCGFSDDHAINYHIRRRCETDHKFLNDCNLVVFSLYINSSVYNFFTSLLAAPFYLPVDLNRDRRGRDSDSRGGHQKNSLHWVEKTK